MIPPGTKLVKELCIALEISKPAAFKRIRGESKLTFNEIMLLCRYLGFSFDQIVNGTALTPKNGFPFYSDALKYKPTSLHEYWANMLNHLDKLEVIPGITSIYLTNEIPFFHYIQFPNLFYFKQFVWNKTSWHIPYPSSHYNKAFFSSDPQVTNIIKEITKTYTATPSTEIWNPEMLNLTMMQLSYYVRSGAFKKIEDIEEILEDIYKLISFMKRMSEEGKKMFANGQMSDKDLFIYLNELTINSEVIFITSPSYRLVYNRYDSPNHIRSDNDVICDHMEGWLDSIINLSTLISKRGQRERGLFFKNMFNQFETYEKKIEGMIKAYY